MSTLMISAPSHRHTHRRSLRSLTEGADRGGGWAVGTTVDQGTGGFVFDGNDCSPGEAGDN